MIIPLMYMIINAQVHLLIFSKNCDLKDLDQEPISVKENVFIEASSVTHFSLCYILYMSFSLDIPPNKKDSELSQGSEVIHDEKGNNQIIECPFYPLSFLVLHEENSSVHVTHEIF